MEFLKRWWWVLLIWTNVPVVGTILVLWLGENSAFSGCLRVIDRTDISSRVFCGKMSEALTWGFKSDFEHEGKVYKWNKHAKIYVDTP